MKLNLKNKGIKSLASILALTIALSGCGSSSSDESRPNKNMELKMATTEQAIESGQLSVPWRQISFVSSVMYRNLFLSTVGESDIEGDLAETYEISEDGLTYEITLKDDVLWSDGEPLTVNDVVFSIESLLVLAEAETVGNIFLTAFSDIVGVSDFLSNPENNLKGLEIDGNTVKITLKNPNNLFLSVLSQFPILPQHALSDIDAKMLLDKNIEYWNDPVCSGMYKLGEHVENDYVKLVYNDKYNRNEAPYINSILLRSDYEYDELDYTETNDVSIILDYRSVTNQNEHNANSIFYRYFIFNIDKGGEPDPVLSDIRVRQAFMHAINRESIIKNVYYGIGYVNNTAAVQEYDNPMDFDYSYDPEKALELLEEAEYDFDRPVTLLYYYSDDTSIKFMNEVGKCLEEIGLTVDILKGNLYSEETDHYDMGLKGLPVFSIEDWYNEYLSSTQLHTDVYGGEPMFDDLVIDLKQATSDEERDEVLAELQALEYELLYKTPVFIMGHKVYISDDVVLPEHVKFGDSKYKYDIQLEDWKINTSK